MNTQTTTTPTMPTMPTMKRTYADVLRTSWSWKEKQGEKKLRQVVRLQDVLKEILEECPMDSKPIDDADDGASSGWYSLTGCDSLRNLDTYRGLKYDEDEEEEGREWNDWWTWGSMHRYCWYRFW